MERTRILELAKKHMLKQGQHEPLVFITMKDGQYYRIEVPGGSLWNENALGRKKTLFLQGREFAWEEAIETDELENLFFVQEFWFVSRPEHEPLPERPSEEADRQECLGLLELAIRDKVASQTFWVAEILRHGGIIDLSPAQQRDNVQSGLLTSFLAGMISAKYSDAEMGQMIENLASKDAKGGQP